MGTPGRMFSLILLGVVFSGGCVRSGPSPFDEGAQSDIEAAVRAASMKDCGCGVCAAKGCGPCHGKNCYYCVAKAMVVHDCNCGQCNAKGCASCGPGCDVCKFHLSPLAAVGNDADKYDKKAGRETAPSVVGLYPFDFCVLSGKRLGSEGDPVIYVHKGREIRFSSRDCIPLFEKDPDTCLQKLDAAIIRQQIPGYPLETCIVMPGEKLGGDMGEPINLVCQNRLVRLCCADCVRDFGKNPTKFLAELDAAIIAKEKPEYPLNTCPVSGDPLGGKMGNPIDCVFVNHLVRICCPDCLKEFAQNPSKFMAKVDEARTLKKDDRK